MSFFLLLLYIFCVFIRPQDWMPGFINKPVMDFLILGTGFFILLERVGSREGFVKAPQNKFLMGMFGCILMSHIVHTYFAGLTLAFSEFLINIIMYFMLINGVASANKLKLASWWSAVLIVILVLQGMYQIEHGYGWAFQQLTPGGGPGSTFRINWIGIFNDPNDLGMAFVMIIGLLMAFLFGKANVFAKFLSLVGISLLIYGIFLTNSRGSMVALMATVGFYFINKSKYRSVGLMLGGIAAAALFILGPSRMSMMSMSEDSAYSRIELWYEGFQMIKSSPIFGVGYDMYTDQLPQTAHNSFILAAAEIGIVGLFCFIGLIWVSFRQLGVIQKNVPELSTYAYGWQTALIGYCAASFFISRTYIVLPYMVFAITGAMFDVARRINPEIEYVVDKKELKTILKLTFAVLLMVLIVIKVGI